MALPLRRAAQGIMLMGTVGSASAAATMNTQPDSGISRTLRFWSSMMPVYAHYKWVEYKSRDMPESAFEEGNPYDPLNKKYAPKMEKLALDMQGFYFKCAQVMSTRDEFIPDEYIKWMKNLQDRQPRTMAPDVVRHAVSESLGKELDSIFYDWEDEPIGAASIGQVHRAKLCSTGEVVAVKLMIPGVEKKFRSDIETVEFFCKNMMPQHAPYFKEIKKQFATEFDYVGEAANLEEVRQMLLNSPYHKEVAVPRAMPELCSKEVLTMTYLEGDRLIDGIRAQYQKMADNLGANLKQLEEEQVERIKRGEVELLDLRTSSRMSTGLKWVLWTRDVMQNLAVTAGNWTIGPFVRDKPWEYVRTERPINLAGIMETLLHVHAYEIFFGGAFNSDPHPGNIMLLPDGRLGLIDYGQFKRMTLEERITYAKVIIALHREDKKEVVRLFWDEIGFKTKHKNEDVIYRAAAFWNDRDTEDITGGMNVHHFMEWIEKEDPPVQVNDEFVMVARVSILLRGMANAFGLKLRVTDYWHREAEKFLAHHGIKY